MGPVNEERAKERLERTRQRLMRQPTPVQYVFVLVGFVLLLGGLVMLVTPGPAFLFIPLGLALLSVKSERAKRAADRIIDTIARGTRLPTRTKVALTAAVVLVVAGAAAWFFLS